MLFMSCVCHAFVSVHFYFVITCWERADLLAQFMIFCCVLSLSHVVSWVRCGIFVSIPDLCHLSYFNHPIIVNL